jgi:hypothetical protein
LIKDSYYKWDKDKNRNLSVCDFESKIFDISKGKYFNSNQIFEYWTNWEIKKDSNVEVSYQILIEKLYEKLKYTIQIASNSMSLLWMSSNWVHSLLVVE